MVLASAYKMLTVLPVGRRGLGFSAGQLATCRAACDCGVEMLLKPTRRELRWVLPRSCGGSARGALRVDLV